MAVALWNTGSDSVLQMLRNVGIEPGAFTKTFLNRFEVDHVKKAAWHEKQQTKTARKKRRQEKKRKTDKHLQTEGITYESGAF